MKSPLERVARAICSAQGLPENTKFEGRPMWESFLPNARGVLQAIRTPSDQMVAAADSLPCSVDTAACWQTMIDAALAEQAG
jgi:hypothetical protein